MEIQLFRYMPCTKKIQVLIMLSTKRQNEVPLVVEPSAERVTAKQGTLNIVFWAYQHAGSWHYTTFMTTKVKRTLDS